MQGLALVFLIAVWAAPAHVRGQTPPGDIAQGHALAIKVCAECHRVAKGRGASSVASAPPFQVIADSPSTTAVSLRVFFRTPHRNMPNLMLRESETDDVIAYILSLK
jgi:mono/diheme cytochrome c family protein